MVKEDTHIFQGMKRDMYPARQLALFLWDAYNIRINSREADDASVGAVSNERGNKSITITFDGNPEDLSNETNAAAHLRGTYLGHCVLGNYLVLFTYYSYEKKDCIYKIDFTDPDNPKGALVYWGNLNIQSPIQTLGVVETDLILKVYWVDNVNSPRVVNIMLKYSPFTGEHNDTRLDFISTLKLEETVDVSRSNSASGSFSPGVIQYAFSYYQKHGQQSNIFYTTELQYISLASRGGSPEEKVSCAFTITMNNIDTEFDFLRIYSIHRSSLDAEPEVKLVVDIELSNVENNTITYTDNGTTGSAITTTELLYIGGEDIVAKTICAKEDTLFLGNIKLNRPSVKSLATKIKESLMVVPNTRRIVLGKSLDGAYYLYYNTLLENSSTFKSGETYRIGVLFQHKTGKWSEPVFIDDVLMTKTPKLLDTGVLELPMFTLGYQANEDSLPKELKNLGYNRARTLVVCPSFLERKVLALGILCPTVFNPIKRYENAPYAQSSWFFRPISLYSFTGTEDSLLNDTVNNFSIDCGAIIEYRHLKPLLSNGKRGCEVLGAPATDFSTVNTFLLGKTNIDGAKKDSYARDFYVDLSILTFHSPDVEFDDNFANLPDDTELKLRIVGITELDANVGDINITTSSAAFTTTDDSNAYTGYGFMHKSYNKSLTLADTLSASGNYLTMPEGRLLVAGPYYRDYYIYYDSSNKVMKALNTSLTNYMIYPWHRSGSLNNDISRPSDLGALTAILDTKILSNLRFSSNNILFNTPRELSIDCAKLFNSDEVAQVKLPSKFQVSANNLNNPSYYGNIDTIVASTTEYLLYEEITSGTSSTVKTLYKEGDSTKDYPGLYLSTDPIRMKYKSSPHMVIALSKDSAGNPIILPSIDGINLYSGDDIVPFWYSGTLVELNNSKYKSLALDSLVDLSTDAGLRNNDNNYDFYVNTETSPKYNGGYRELYEWVVNTDDNSKGVWTLCSLDRMKDLLVEGMECKTSYTSDGKEVISIYTIKNYGWYVLVNTDNYSNAVNDSGSIILDITYTNQQLTIHERELAGTIKKPFMYLAELYRDDDSIVNRFGGSDDVALLNNLWIPAGKAVTISDIADEQLVAEYGDTWYLRYDCLKTYPFTNADPNLIIEIASFLCETRVNIDGRYDKKRGLDSNLAVSKTNFNLLNDAYSLKDNYFNYRILDVDYYTLDTFPSLVTWTLTKQAAALIDNWTNITLASTLDLEGNKGPINSIVKSNNNLLAFLDNAISVINFNSRVQIPVSDGVPIQISNSGKVDSYTLLSTNHGCKYPETILESDLGLYFVNSIDKCMYLYSKDGFTNLSQELGFQQWSQLNNITKVWNNSRLKDIYFVTDSGVCLGFSEELKAFQSFYDYGEGTSMINILNNNYSFINKGYDGENTSTNYGYTTLWKNQAGNYNVFFNNYRPYYLTFISNAEPTLSKVFDTLEMRTSVFDGASNTYIDTKPFTKIKVYNDYQDSDTVSLTTMRRPEVFNKLWYLNIVKKFNIWRVLIPRNKGTRLRIRNMWTAIELSEPTPTTNRINLQDITVKYSI